jgi:3-oxoacyl-[acyl-carrier protein] reductase
MDLQLKGKRALVTGGSRGLGYATALGLAREGAQVAINSRSEAGLTAAAQAIRAETGNSQVLAFAGNVVDPAVPAEVVSQAAQVMGGLDILITNSGGPPSGKFESFDDAAWQNAIELSLLSHVRLVRAALPICESRRLPAC